MSINILDNKDVSYLDDLLIKDGVFIVRSFEELKDIPQEDISIFCLNHALYQLPTKELIDFLKSEINDNLAIEIGSGAGIIGKALGIKCTDSCMQELPEIKMYYESLSQPTIKYPDYVERIDAISAVNKYNPDIVIGSWCTQLYKPYFSDGIKSNFWGIDEKLMMTKINKYIHIGNEKTHDDKEIFNTVKCRKYKFPYLLSRSLSRNLNIIYIFENG